MSEEQGDWIGGAKPHFDGVTYNPAIDHDRLTTMLTRTAHCLLEREWWTLHGLAKRVSGLGDPKASSASEAGVSARLRDLRKAKFAGVEIDRARVKGGLWHYRCHPNSVHKLARWLSWQ